jgi:O-antigen/teichoic acid export membrane protein
MVGWNWTHILTASAARFYSLAISTLIMLITARTLGPASHGILVASLTWVTLFTSFSSLSIEQVAHFRIQFNRGSDWLPKMCGTLLFLGALLSITAMTAGILLANFFRTDLFRNIPPFVLSFAFCLLPLFLFEQYLSSLLAATDQITWYNRAQYAGRSLWLLLTSVFLYVFEFDVPLALTAQLCGQSVVVLVASAGLIRGGSRKISVDFTEARELLKGSAKLHLNSVGAFVLSQSAILFLNYFATTSEVAWFQIANQIVLSLLVIPYAASTVLYSRIAQSSPDRVWQDQKKIMSGVIAMISLLSAIGFFAAPWAIPLLLGNQYSPAVSIFRWLLPTVLGLSFAQLMAPQWISRGKFTWTASATVTAAFLNLIANAILIPRLHVMGAVWVSLITYLGLTVVTQFTFAWWCETKSRLQLNAAPQ